MRKKVDITAAGDHPGEMPEELLMTVSPDGTAKTAEERINATLATMALISDESQDGSVRSGGWNAYVSGSTSSSATPSSWTCTIQPGQSGEFGAIGQMGTKLTDSISDYCRRLKYLN